MDLQSIGDLAIARSEAVATITIDRQGKLNALTNAFWGDPRSALTLIDRD